MTMLTNYIFKLILLSLMAERFRLKTNVTKVEACKFCPGNVGGGYKAYKGESYRPDMIYDYNEYCEIAKLEQIIGRVPTYREVLDMLNFDKNQSALLNKISSECPNKYHGFIDLPASDRKK